MPATDPNRNLYIVIAVLLAALFLLLLAYLYERRRAKQKMHIVSKVAPAPAPVAAASPAPVAPAPKATTPDESTSGPEAPASPAPVVSPSAAPGSFEGIYGGKTLYESLVAGTCASIDKWSSIDISNFIEYYRLNNREFVDRLESDYNNLSRNHKMFLILLNMGKSDAEIQKLMNITQTTIRSIRFRIKAKRKNGDDPEDTQTHIQF